MRFGEELLGIGGEERLLLCSIRDAYGDDVGTGHARLLRLEAFVPDPEDPLLLAVVDDRERKAIFCFNRLRKRQRDAAHVVLISHVATRIECHRRRPHRAMSAQTDALPSSSRPSVTAKVRAPAPDVRVVEIL